MVLKFSYFFSIVVNIFIASCLYMVVMVCTCHTKNCWKYDEWTNDDDHSVWLHGDIHVSLLIELTSFEKLSHEAMPMNKKFLSLYVFFVFDSVQQLALSLVLSSRRLLFSWNKNEFTYEMQLFSPHLLRPSHKM